MLCTSIHLLISIPDGTSLSIIFTIFLALIRLEFPPKLSMGCDREDFWPGCSGVLSLDLIMLVMAAAEAYCLHTHSCVSKENWPFMPETWDLLFWKA